jgi:hypothetical protein
MHVSRRSRIPRLPRSLALSPSPGDPAAPACFQVQPPPFAPPPHPSARRVPPRPEPPLARLSSQLQRRLALLCDALEPLGAGGSDAESIVGAIARLRAESEYRAVSRACRQRARAIAEIKEGMPQLTDLAERKAALEVEVRELERAGASVPEKVTREAVRELAANCQTTEGKLFEQESRYRMRYTKFKEKVEGLASGLAFLRAQVNALDGRLLLMRNKGSSYGQLTRPEQQRRQEDVVEIGQHGQRPNSAQEAVRSGRFAPCGDGLFGPGVQAETPRRVH